MSLTNPTAALPQPAASDEPQAYVGINGDCGHARALVVYDDDATKAEKRRVRQQVNRWRHRARGLEVRCIPLADARKMLGGCSRCSEVYPRG